jgi:hypothetical protein
VFGAGAPKWAACVPTGDASCTPSLDVTCVGGVATSCPAGVTETVDCFDLLQQAPNACNPGTLAPSFDWTSRCFVDAGIKGDAGKSDGGTDAAVGCTSDTCSGTVMTSCYRGAAFKFDCTYIGGGCTVDDAGSSAKCTLQ